MPLKNISGFLFVNCCGRNELYEEGFYGLFVDRMAFDLDCWCSGDMVVANSIYVGPNALEGCVNVRGGLENCL